MALLERTGKQDHVRNDKVAKIRVQSGRGEPRITNIILLGCSASTDA